MTHSAEPLNPLEMLLWPSLSSRNTLADVIEEIVEDAESKAKRMHIAPLEGRVLTGKKQAPTILLHVHCASRRSPSLYRAC